MKLTSPLYALALMASVLLVGDADAQMRDDCKFQQMDRGSWTDHEVKATIRCAADKWHVPGGKDKALDVARCESGFEARTSGSHLGVYQFAPATWRSQVRRFAERRHRWDVGTHALNARNNVMVAIWMAHAGGWGPWSCA